MGDWRALVRQKAAEEGLDLPEAMVEEMALHLEDLHESALAEGASTQEARGKVVRALEESALSDLRRHTARESASRRLGEREDLALTRGGGSLLMWSSMRIAIRQFRRQPGFAMVAILVLGLGTGAATTVGSLVDSILLRPLPYRAPDGLVALWDTNYEKGLAHDPLSPVNFMDYRGLPVFEDAAAWWRPGINLTDPGQEPVRVKTIETSANLFAVLGVKPQVGRGFPAFGPLYVENELVAVISDRLWRTRYGADPKVVGRRLLLNDTPHEVLGVMPPRFHYPDDVDVWQRLRWDMSRHSRQAHFMEAVGRLSEGTTLEQAQAASDTLALRLAHDFPDSNQAWGVRLTPILEDQLGYYRPALAVLFGAVALLLVIGCLNVASLMLTRALSREKEIGVRIALGASPRQLLTQLLCEGLALSVAGAVLGLGVAAVAVPLVVRLTPVPIPRLEEAVLRGSALGIGVGVAVATTLLFALVPASILVKRTITSALKGSERGSSRGARWIYSTLVAGEVALACVLLVSSALLVRTVSRMMQTPTGVDADEVATTSLQLSGNAYPEWPVVASTHAAVLQQIRGQSGIQVAGSSNFLPLEAGWRSGFGIEGVPAPVRLEDAPQAQFHSVSDGYFEALGVRLAAGRFFTAFDGVAQAPVVVVNETFAKRFLTGRPPVGQVFVSGVLGIGPLGRNLLRGQGPAHRHAPPTRYEVIGVVKDVRNVPLGQTIEPAVYFSALQFPFREQYLVVRATDPGAASRAIQTALKSAAPGIPMGTVETWGARFRARTAEPRLLMSVLVLFGGVAGALAAIGVYGMFSWIVVQRTRELAIRLALGARPYSIGGIILRQSATLALAGLVAGLALVRIGEGALSRVLYEVSPSDLAAISSASLLLLVAALGAGLAPARRAMRVDPVEGLRAE